MLKLPSRGQVPELKNTFIQSREVKNTKCFGFTSTFGVTNCSSLTCLINTLVVSIFSCGIIFSCQTTRLKRLTPHLRPVDCSIPDYQCVEVNVLVLLNVFSSQPPANRAQSRQNVTQARQRPHALLSRHHCHVDSSGLFAFLFLIFLAGIKRQLCGRTTV